MSHQIRLVHIVDDDEANRDSLRMLLEGHGFETRCWGSAKELLQTDHADMKCLILDLHMPEMSGLELLQILRGQDLSVPIIVVSGGLIGPVKADTRRAGASAILSKPFDAHELLGLVSAAMAA